MQETDPEDLVDKFVEAMDLEYSEAAILQLGGGTDHSEELPGKSVEKDNCSKIRKDWQ